MTRNEVSREITKLFHSDGNTDNWLVVRKLMTGASQVSIYSLLYSLREALY